jgi:hypothetical protein
VHYNASGAQQRVCGGTILTVRIRMGTSTTSSRGRQVSVSDEKNRIALPLGYAPPTTAACCTTGLLRLSYMFNEITVIIQHKLIPIYYLKIEMQVEI